VVWLSWSQVTNYEGWIRSVACKVGVLKLVVHCTVPDR